MTLIEVIRTIEGIAQQQPAINTIIENDVYALNAMPDARYGVFAFVQGQHTATVENDMASFKFSFFYVDRLTLDGSNQLDVQSAGISVLDNIIRTLDDEGMNVGSWTYQPFTQRFADHCAGVYADVTVNVPVSYVCAQTWEQGASYLLTSEGWYFKDVNGNKIIVRE